MTRCSKSAFDLIDECDILMSEDFRRKLFPDTGGDGFIELTHIGHHSRLDMQWPNEIVSALRKTWQRLDRRQQVFAPGFNVFQALTLDGQSASGGAETSDGAVRRLMGETAEIAFLADGLAPEFDRLHDGIAADPDRDTASKRALLEAFERKRILQWWNGDIDACPMNTVWLSENRLADWLDNLRQGGLSIRHSRLFRLPTIAGESVMIAMSEDASHQEPVLGFGTAPDPVEAAYKALREMLLMEMRVVELHAALEGANSPEGFVKSIQSELRRVGKRCRKLLGTGGPEDTPALSPNVNLKEIEAWLGGVRYTPHPSLPCVMCKPKGKKIMVDKIDDLPFYSDLGQSRETLLGSTAAADLVSFGCCPAPGPQFSSKHSGQKQSGSTSAPATRLPAIAHLTADKAWRLKCLRETSKIPSGYTYLAQLVGHDMGNSAPLDRVVYARREPCSGTMIPKLVQTNDLNSGRGQRNPVRYNLIENPLTLETVYGPGPELLNHVYNQETGKFHLEKSSVLAKTFEIEGLLIRALYDGRNRDTLMLHELTVAWMLFHNRNMDRLKDIGHTWDEAYRISRVHSVLVWHDIIRNDLMPQFVLPGYISVPMEKLPSVGEATLLHAVFRAFHSMPLDSYRLRPGNIRGKKLSDLMRRGFATTFAEQQWEIDWNHFFEGMNFEEGQSLPVSGISTSTASSLIIGGSHLIHHDFDTAKETDPVRLGGDWVKSISRSWPSDLTDVPPPMTAEEMCTEFKDRYGPERAIVPTALENAPLFEALMVEAQLQGEKGGLGSLGSALLRGALEGAMSRVAFDDDVSAERDEVSDRLLTPCSMLQLIEQTREETS